MLMHETINMDQSTKALGINMRRLRDRANISQDALAEKASLSRGTIAQIETFRAKATRYETIERLAKALGVTVRELTSMPQGEGPADPYIKEFLESPLAKQLQLTDNEKRWLGSLPGISWMGDAPTPMTFFYMVEALRRRNKAQ